MIDVVMSIATAAAFVMVRAGYRAGFLVLAAIAAVGFLVFLLAMPESKSQQALPESEAGAGDTPARQMP